MFGQNLLDALWEIRQLLSCVRSVLNLLPVKKYDLPDLLKQLVSSGLVVSQLQASPGSIIYKTRLEEAVYSRRWIINNALVTRDSVAALSVRHVVLAM